MKTFLYRFFFLLINLLLSALDLFFLVDGLQSENPGDSFFVAFCLSLSTIFSLILAFLAFLSFKKGDYYLPEIMFDEDKRPAKMALIIFGSIAFLALFACGWFLTALWGINPYVNTPKNQCELIVAIAAQIGCNSLLCLLYVPVFRFDIRNLRER